MSTLENINGYETSIHHSGCCLCGYVLIPEGHPWNGKDYDDLTDVHVHGGLTYCAKADGHAGLESKGGWIIGFDCAHAGDLIPLIGALSAIDEYKDEDYVRGEIKRLTLQAKVISHAN